MAIFENRYEYVQELDDTIPLKCTIETAQNINGHTEYILRVQRGFDGVQTWKILRRYNDFVQLQKSLNISGIVLPFPPKKVFGNMRPDFIAQRREALQLYINAVLMNPILASSLPARRFVDPDSYSQSFHDQAVQDTVLCLRSDNQWTLGSTMGAIGWRLRKHYFKVTQKPPDKSSSKLLVKSGSQSHQSKHGATLSSTNGGSSSFDNSHLEGSEIVLEWTKYGPDKFIEEKEIGTILKCLMGLQHPYIEPIIYAAHNENGVVTIRKFYKHGTLKDHLCLSTPKNPFLTKYGNPKGRTILSIKQVALYGYQLLEALIFLHSKGYPHGHLHSGNIVIIDDQVKLLDIENFIIGVPAFYRPFFVQHSKIHTIESVDVYCFGHVLFEMAMGYPLQESVVRQINDCPELLKHLLESILSKEACKTGLPTLEQLSKHQFFIQVNENQNSESANNKAHFKLPINTKEFIKQVILKFEHRLREEQKSVKNQKRIVRVQELMSSEEEKRKTKHKAKLDLKQSKLKQQSSLQANNGRLPFTVATSSGVSGSSAAPFERTDSSLAVQFSDEATGESFQQSSTEAKLSPADDITGEMKSNVSIGSVERQSSTPNILAEETGGEPTRSALLESICKFNRGSLRKVRSND